MTTERLPRRVTHQGTPAMGQVLAHMLEEEGARVEQQPQPAEQRDLASMLERVASSLEVYGTTLAINAAVDRFRKLFPDAGGSVTIEGDDDGDRHSSPSLFRARSGVAHEQQTAREPGG